LGGDYGGAVLVLSNFFSSFPFLLAISLLSGTIIYYMVKFHPGFPHYAFFCINLFCCLSVIETCMMIVASLVPNVLMGIGIGTGVIVSKVHTFSIKVIDSKSLICKIME